MNANGLEEWKGMYLSKAIGCKPNAQGINNWEEEAAKTAPSIKTNLFPVGQGNGYLSIVIS